MNTTVGVFTTHLAADSTIKELRAYGVPAEDLSYVYMDIEGHMHDYISSAKINSGAATGVTAGAVVGALAGLAVANGILPGLGTLFVAGPLATALGLTGAAATTAAGAATGLAAGGLLGGLSAMGINSTDTSLYQSLVKQGDVLVVARSKKLITKDIFARGGATEVREYIEE